MVWWTWICGLCLGAATLCAQPATLAERLGYSPKDRLLIINADDGGLAHAENLATLDALRRGLVGSATLMATCPWFPEIAAAAAADPRLDFGVHLVVTSEWEAMRWGPVLGRTAVPSLVDAQGYLLGSVRAVHAQAKPAEVEAECRAQIQKTLDAGVDVSHLDMHMHALALDARLFEVYVKLAREFDLPARFLPTRDELWEVQRARFAAAGILTADRLYPGAPQPGETVADTWRRVIRGLKPGVSELYIHVALDHPEMQALTGQEPMRTGWRDRAEEYRLFTTDPGLRRLLEIEGIKLIRWRDLRDLQRRERPKP
ncbi:MAG: polysaccharide deacetylase family protein [Holophagaceae bacterium]|uniref:Polysaccharide deacetylase family protein n=1 Tax=Candidatus Geothrix skivensis TaxID=2954439 RepID=A0A9D7SK86_9BACT|nr:polysaccharide deacetylase family protein [Candidatus Geothrix skivensis]